MHQNYFQNLIKIRHGEENPDAFNILHLHCRSFVDVSSKLVLPITSPTLLTVNLNSKIIVNKETKAFCRTTNTYQSFLLLLPVRVCL